MTIKHKFSKPPKSYGACLRDQNPLRDREIAKSQANNKVRERRKQRHVRRLRLHPKPRVVR